MGDYHTFYGGSDNGLDPDYSGSERQYVSSAADIGLTTDARTAAQLKEVSRVLNTGAKTVEVSLVSPQVFEAIPQQHFEEINRLRKLVGAELTLHAPVVEPTGVTRQGWDESQRIQAERQLWNAIEQGHKLNPEGNVVITMHSSAALPEAETRIIENGKPVLKEFGAVDERTGHFTLGFKVLPSALEGEIPPSEDPIKITLKNENEKAWFSTLQHINFNVEQGSNAIENAIKAAGKEVDWEILRKKEKEVKSELLGLYKEYEEGKSDKLSEFGEYKELILDKLKDIERGDISIRSAYGDFKEQFDKAYESASEENKKRLKEFSNEIQPKIKELKTNPAKIVELKEALQKGIHLLHSIKAPEVLKPLREFAIDKASETFSNLACESYKKFGESSPIISIENPPAGGGLSRGKDLKELVEKAREKFKEKAIKELGLSKEKAKEEAEKLIGVTWDVGHINMLRKYGYTEEELEEETRKIAEFAKHVHLSDNFGMEHTELPMGMGNVPSEQMLKILGEYNKKLKKIAETGDWYQHFQISPLADVLSHYKSPIYAMQNAPYWSQETVGQMGAYFGGYGTNPDIHHATYGAGFSGLPPELGGQMGKSRLSGAPID